MRNQILRKSILFIIYCFLFVPGFAKDKGNLFEADMSSTYFDNQISILGINEEKCVLMRGLSRSVFLLIVLL